MYCGDMTGTNLYQSASWFFSYPGASDYFRDPSFSFITNTQKFFASGLESYFMSLESLHNRIYNPDLFMLDAFNRSDFFSPSIIEGTNLFSISNSLANNINDAATHVSSDVTLMFNVFPEYQNVIEWLEFYSIEDDGSLVEKLSTPDVKLYYPEPFIASPSFVHEDLWFIHILHYQHWLWFMFISLIMFYFITFINVVRWCNMRTKPKRETRGVSRSKCADLITATVPVTWAISIIVSESVDASDYYDGFGTGEIVIGIRAYQWGWEYFYPKGIDLNYNVKPSYSTMVGNSLKYTNTGSKTLESNSLWKSYQSKKNSQITNTPAHLLLSPSNTSNLINFANLNDAGISTLKDSSAFKKIQYFSKTNPQSLTTTSTDFSLKYNKLSNLYLSDNASTSTNAYGTFRQHNYAATLASTNGANTLLDPNSVQKFSEYTLNLDTYNNDPSIKSGLANRSITSRSSLNTSRIVKEVSNLNTVTNPSASKLASHPSITTILNSESDGKQIKDPFRYLLTEKWSKNSKSLASDYESINGNTNYPIDKPLSTDADLKNDGNNTNNANVSKAPSSSLKRKSLVNNAWSQDISYSVDLSVNSPITKSTNGLFNKNLAYRFNDLKASSQQFLASDRNTRSLDKVNSAKNAYNLTGSLNTIDNLQSNINSKSLNTSINSMFRSSLLDWQGSRSLNVLAQNGTTLPSPHAPQLIRNATQQPYGFDRFLKADGGSTPHLLRSKEESAPNYLFNTYWLTYWSHTNPIYRYEHNMNTLNTLSNSYFPNVVDYAEYDFRNAQAAEMLEDAFWESTYSSFIHDEYIEILQSSHDHQFFKEQEELFNNSNRHRKFRGSKLAKPLLRDLSASTTLNSLPIFTEDTLPNSLLLPLVKFQPFASELSLDSLDETYSGIKQLSYLHGLNYKNTLNVNSNNIQPFSYTAVLDAFQPSYEESSWYIDQSNESSDESNSSVTSTTSDTRLANPMKLRSTARSSIVTYNAIQKVFKSRFDEGRSHARLQDFSNSYVAHPFITEKKSPYEGLLGKNKNSFFNVTNYKQSFITNFNLNYSIWNSMNVYFADIPFLLAMKSDASRYLWFDWQSRWSSIEIQPSSVSRYSLLGVPYTNKSFEYATQIGDEINDSENYLVRLARARKNYMSNWAYTPYFYARVSNWYKSGLASDNMWGETSLKNTRLLLRQTASSLKSVQGPSSTHWSSYSTPSYSGVNTAGRSSWRPSSSMQSYHYNSSILVDILTKREYLYRQYFQNKGFTTTLPLYLTATPKNPLLNEIKSSYAFIDPIAFSSESSREVFYQNTSFLKFTILKDALILSSDAMAKLPINVSGLSNYLFLKLFGLTNSNTSLGQNYELYKNQYRPMKKGVTNMIRLHSTGAIAMPIEIRLHILASSKDVIHSWAIPSAGIKIDCVPGYSSHRVTIFLVSGIFWGQCMEICGRFHHWMPIVVYFMKRDLFFLWCTHFMHYSSIDNVFNMTDRQLTDSIRLASYDKSTWINEINKIF